jgi:hypothetical protein
VAFEKSRATLTSRVSSHLIRSCARDLSLQEDDGTGHVTFERCTRDVTLPVPPQHSNERTLGRVLLLLLHHSSCCVHAWHAQGDARQWWAWS